MKNTLRHRPYNILFGLCVTGFIGVNVLSVPQAFANNQGASELIRIDNNLSNIPQPVVSISQVKFIERVLIPITTDGNNTLDVSEIDDFIADMSSNARHYPPNFPSTTQKYHALQRVKHYVELLKPYVNNDSASYDILIRSAQLNGMARNLDLGTSYTVNGNQDIIRALNINPNSLEANLLYGIMLSEGGAFTTGRKYLNKASVRGSVEAEQTIAQSELMEDKKPQALQRLYRLQSDNPNNKQIATQIAIINNGKYRIWDIAYPISIKPMNSF